MGTSPATLRLGNPGELSGVTRAQKDAAGARMGRSWNPAEQDANVFRAGNQEQGGGLVSARFRSLRAVRKSLHHLADAGFLLRTVVQELHAESIFT